MLALIDEQVAQIAASIREWGWTVPVLVDEDGTLIAGHGRVLAAQRLGVTDVPTMVARGWSDARKRAYVIDPRRRDAVAVPLPAPLPAHLASSVRHSDCSGSQAG